jgi:hypothetical protein
MQIGSLDLPDEVLTALEEDRLVLFAGAGVSKPPPASLPNFQELVEGLVQRSLSPDEVGQMDRVLGRAKDQSIAVHRLAAQRLGLPGSRFNPLHENLVALFGSAGSVRVVTTNFDQHFEGAIAARNGLANVKVYTAPALCRWAPRSLVWFTSMVPWEGLPRHWCSRTRTSAEPISRRAGPAALWWNYSGSTRFSSWGSRRIHDLNGLPVLADPGCGLGGRRETSCSDLVESLARRQPTPLGDGELQDRQELPLEGTMGPGGSLMELGDQILRDVLDEQIDSHGVSYCSSGADRPAPLKDP